MAGIEVTFWEVNRHPPKFEEQIQWMPPYFRRLISLGSLIGVHLRH